MSRRHLAAVFLTITTLAALWLSVSSSPKKKETTAEVASDKPISAKSNPPRQKAETKAPVDTREKNPFRDKARSLRGTDIDGALRLLPDGSLLIGPDLIKLFDYFFTTVGEESDETIKQRILAVIRERLNGPAAQQASALLDQYLRYRKDAESLSLPKAEEADPSARLEATKKLRRKTFGEETAEKLFGDEEREGEVAIAEKKVREDQTLTEEEREKKLADLEAQLPESARVARETATLPLRGRNDVEAMRAEGATDDDVHAYRTETFGTEAADRLAALDQERAAWKARIEAFEKERAKLLETLSEEAFPQAEQALLDKSFNPTEQRRVRATLLMKEKEK